jgi:DNA-directed RNA polymerase subunit RPC12/RpoP
VRPLGLGRRAVVGRTRGRMVGGVEVPGQGRGEEFEMALIECADCGKEVSERAESCPNCGAPIAGKKVQKVVAVHPDVAAGHEAGEGCAMLLTSKPVAFIVFIVTWLFGTTYLAMRTGYYVEGEDPALWVGFVILVLPFILAFVLRKPIAKFVPIVMGSGILIAVVLFFIFGALMAISMVLGLFHWPGAQ